MPLQRTTCAVLLAWAIAGCSSPQERAERKAASANVGGTFELSPLEEQMHEHWGLAGWLRRAVIAGRLDEVPRAAGLLAAHEPADGVPTWTPHVERLRAQAQAAAAASSLPEVAAATAELGATCGACHGEVGAVVRRTLPEPPAGEQTVGVHMQRHAWAAEAMWIGLVTPADDEWLRGAQMLAERPLREDEYFSRWLVTDELVALGTEVHDLGVRAREASPGDRPALYGEFLATCAECHTRLRR